MGGSALEEFRKMTMASSLQHICFVGIDPPKPAATAKARGAPRLQNYRPLAPAKPSGADSRESAVMDPFLAWLLKRGGLNPDVFRASALERRIPACLRCLRVGCVEDARALLEKSPSLISKALDAVLIGVSEFFRDETVFQELRQKIVPELLRHRHALRVLSAGCSEGQELYSIAMILDELGALKASILRGLDCRTEAINRACAGAFAISDLQRLPPEWRQRYFKLDNSRAQIAPPLGSAVFWQVADLFSYDQPGAWDLLLFRNVAIYLRAESAAPLWHQFAERLAPWGILVTGKAEQPPRSLPLARVGHSIYQKVEA